MMEFWVFPFDLDIFLILLLNIIRFWELIYIWKLFWIYEIIWGVYHIVPGHYIWYDKMMCANLFGCLLLLSHDKDAIIRSCLNFLECRESWNDGFSLASISQCFGTLVGCETTQVYRMVHEQISFLVFKIYSNCFQIILNYFMVKNVLKESNCFTSFYGEE